MINKFEKKLYNLGQKIGLTFDEREAMRSRLLAKIAASERRDILSPYSPFYYWRTISFYIKPQYVSMALVVVMLVGGISVAAEKALPGEPLYQVKTSVNENVLALFAFTPQSKAQLHTQLAVRRLEEVETLAMAGKLDATTTAEAESKIDDNLAVVKDSVKQLATSNNDQAAAVTSSQAESSLKVHEAILDTLASAVTPDSAVQDMATKVSIQATALSLDRAAIDSKNSSTSPSIDALFDQQKVAQDVVTSAQKSLASSTISTASSTVDDPVISPGEGGTTPTSTAPSIMGTSFADDSSDQASVGKAQSKFQEAEDLLKKGKEKLDNKDYGEAFILFKKAEATAVEARNLLESENATSTSPTSTTTPSSNTLDGD